MVPGLCPGLGSRAPGLNLPSLHPVQSKTLQHRAAPRLLPTAPAAQSISPAPDRAPCSPVSLACGPTPVPMTLRIPGGSSLTGA